jgi:hypothetical protein
MSARIARVTKKGQVAGGRQLFMMPAKQVRYANVYKEMAKGKEYALGNFYEERSQVPPIYNNPQYKGIATITWEE